MSGAELPKTSLVDIAQKLIDCRVALSEWEMVGTVKAINLTMITLVAESTALAESMNSAAKEIERIRSMLPPIKGDEHGEN